MPLAQGAQVVPKDFWSQSPYLAAVLAVVAATLYYMDRQSQRAREAQKERDDDLREYLETRDEMMMQTFKGSVSATKANQQILMGALERNSEALESMSKALGPVLTVLDLSALQDQPSR